MILFTVARKDDGHELAVVRDFLGAIEQGLVICGMERLGEDRCERDPEVVGWDIEFGYPTDDSIEMKILTLNVYPDGREDVGWHDSAIIRRWEL